MNFSLILKSFLSVSILGGFLGVMLSVFSKILAVKKDKRLEKLEEILPGLNCGACGYAGCSSYAEAMLADEAVEINLCAPGGPPCIEQLASFLDRESGEIKEKMVAKVHCRGNRERAKDQYEYRGVKDCNAAFLMFKGDKVCKFGCLGYGSCIAVCPVDAISYDSEGCVVVDKEACISCGKCITVCPSGVMKYIPYNADYYVACNSQDKGGLVKKYCSVGCIGCKICEKKSPEGGYVVENFLASINYKIDGSRKEGADACPSKCINSCIEGPDSKK